MSVLANGQPGPRFELPRYLINKIPPQVGALASLAIVSLALSVVYRTLQDIQLSERPGATTILASCIGAPGVISHRHQLFCINGL